MTTPVDSSSDAFTPRQFQNLMFDLMLASFPEGHEFTLDEVGAFLGMSRERVRQIQAEAVVKMAKAARRPSYVH